MFNGAIVDWKVLPGLVRATAINASQVMRSLKPYYQSLYPFFSSKYLFPLRCILKANVSGCGFLSGDVFTTLTIFSFEERAKYVDLIAKQHKDPVMFEEFAALVFAPVLPQGVYPIFTFNHH